MGFCTFCGAPRDEGSRFCPTCGHAFDEGAGATQGADSPATQVEPPTVGRKRKRGLWIALALLAVVVLVAGAAALWLFVVAPGLDPTAALERIEAALEAGDEDALRTLVTDDLADKAADLEDQSLADVLETAGISDARNPTVNKEANNATVSFRSDAGDTELRFSRDGFRWRLNEVVTITLKEVTAEVEAPKEYVDTEYLAEGETAQKSVGQPGESVTVYEVRVVNGVAKPEEKVEEREVTRPVAEEWWRGTGDESPHADRLSGLRAGDSYDAETHKIEDPHSTLALDAEMFAIGFHAEPVDPSMSFYVVFLKPDGTFFEDVAFSPDPTWTYMNAVDYIDESQTAIMPGLWHAAIMIDDQPAGLVSFEVE